MYLCVRGDALPLSTTFFYWVLEMFRQCGIYISEEAARMLLVCLDLLTVINGLRVRAMVLNATLNNISVIAWW
jgi:hypothetical protein